MDLTQGLGLRLQPRSWALRPASIHMSGIFVGVRSWEHQALICHLLQGPCSLGPRFREPISASLTVGGLAGVMGVTLDNVRLAVCLVRWEAER